MDVPPGQMPQSKFLSLNISIQNGFPSASFPIRWCMKGLKGLGKEFWAGCGIVNCGFRCGGSCGG